MKQPKRLVLIRDHGSAAFSATADAGLYAAVGTTKKEAVSRLCQSMKLSEDQVDAQDVPTPHMEETPPWSH